MLVMESPATSEKSHETSWCNCSRLRTVSNGRLIAWLLAALSLEFSLGTGQLGRTLSTFNLACSSDLCCAG